MRNKLKKYLMIMMGVVMMLSFSGCALKGENAKGIFAKENENNPVYYCYRYSNCFNPTATFYILEIKQNSCVYTFQDENNPDYGQMSMEVPEELFDRIKEIYHNHKAYRFNGFSKTNMNALDGDSFSMEMIFADGEEFTVSGTNCAPENFSSFEKEINALFEPYNTQLLEQAKKENIEKGVRGHLQGFMVSIVQHGTYGKEDYTVHAYSLDSSTSNLSVHIKSADETRFAAKEVSFSKDVPTISLHYDELEELINECEMAQWIDYHTYSSDTANCEWFQISFTFEEGTINATGSLPPQNYEKFREKFEHILIKLVKENE